MKSLYWIKRGSKFVFDLIDLNQSFLRGKYIFFNQLIYQTTLTGETHLYSPWSKEKMCNSHFVKTFRTETGQELERFLNLDEV